MPFCSWCGKQVAVGTEICPACGYGLKTAVSGTPLGGAGGKAVTIDAKAMAKTTRRRQAFLVTGAIMGVVGTVFAVYGTNNLLCGIGYTLGSVCGYSTWAFTEGTFGGILLGAGLVVFALGLSLGRFMYVTR